MFMILPNSSNGVADQGSLEETRTRVKKACNRCRVKKIKCNGRFPCARCERDEVVCRVERGPADQKNMSRSYIASLEEQQLSLLNALRELNRQFPDDSKMHGIMKQLQANGFDVGLSLPQDQAFEANEITGMPENLVLPQHSDSRDDGNFTAVDSTDISYLQSLLIQGGNIDPQAMPDFWALQDPLWPQNVQQNYFLNTFTEDDAIAEGLSANSVEFALNPSSINQAQRE